MDCLDCYRDECRNGCFHKDNVDDWDIVETVKANTIFIYVLLLGCCKLNGDDMTVKGLLGIIEDDRLEQLYYQIRHNHISTIGIRFEENGELINYKILPATTFPASNDNGILKDYAIINSNWLIGRLDVADRALILGHSVEVNLRNYSYAGSHRYSSIKDKLSS